MSFYAGNKKIHITQASRDSASLDTDTIYTDTVFHSNMKMLCSLGEHTVVAQKVQYYIENKEFPTNIQTEYCFEAEIPAEVQTALAANYVVITSMGDFAFRQSIQDDTMHTGYDVAVSFPLNIKTGKGCITDSGNASYGVAVSPQITTGGILDISYSYNKIALRTISVNANLEEGYASSSGSTNKIMGWSQDPDYALPGGKVPNLKRGVSRFMQYHARGVRWKLSDYTIYAANQPNKVDNPYMRNLDLVPAPKFHFIILNVQFINGQFVFINPITEAQTPTNDIKMSSGQILVNGVDLTSLKVLMSLNGYANSFIDFGSKSLNRIPSPTVYSSVSLSYVTRNNYHMWNSINFMQGAKYNNQKLAILPTPGPATTLKLYPKYSPDVLLYRDLTLLNYPLKAASGFDINQNLGYPSPGIIGSNYPNTYYRAPDHTLLEHTTTNAVGSESQETPFALIDTSNFTGLYIDKDGIKGTFDGRMIPIYNTLSTPTYMITNTLDVVVNGHSLSGLTWTKDEISNYSIKYDEEPFPYPVSKAASLLVCVELVDSAPYDNNLTISGGYPNGSGGYTIPNSDNAIFITDTECNIANVGGKEYGLIKIWDGQEIILTQGYIAGSLKYQNYTGVTGAQGSVTGSNTVDNLSVYFVHTLKMTNQKIELWGKFIFDADHDAMMTGGVTSPPNAVSMVFSSFKVPDIRVSFVKIQ